MQATARAARAIPPGIGSGAEQSSSLAQANSALAKENADLRRANAELEQFTWTAAHDLKEPLRMVTSWLDLLDQRCSVQLADEAQEFLRCAMQGAVRMRGLIDDLLDFARLGTSTPTLERVNSEIAVTAALANLDPAIRESGAEIECAVLPDILVDLGLLTLVFQNLIGNAIKFRGVEAPRIRISATGTSEGWVFSVQDNGIGIGAEHVDRIFQAFERLHSADEYPGSGIGLAIVQRIIEKHGGRIWVESKKGEGATFLFVIPDCL